MLSSLVVRPILTSSLTKGIQARKSCKGPFSPVLPLHLPHWPLLFPLPGMFFCQIPIYLPLSVPLVLSNVTFSERTSLNTLFKTNAVTLSPYTALFFSKQLRLTKCFKRICLFFGRDLSFLSLPNPTA